MPLVISQLGKLAQMSNNLSKEPHLFPVLSVLEAAQGQRCDQDMIEKIVLEEFTICLLLFLRAVQVKQLSLGWTVKRVVTRTP